jgi:hypothetical protein
MDLALDLQAQIAAIDGPTVAEERQGTHWQDCWRVDGHHACAIHLLDLMFREVLIDADEARRQLTEAKKWAAECEEFGCHGD